MFIYMKDKKTNLNGVIANRRVGVDYDAVQSPFSHFSPDDLTYVTEHLYSGNDMSREYGLQKLKVQETAQTVFMFDCYYDNSEIYRVFPMRSVPVNDTDVYGNTALMYAAQNNSLKMLDIMKKNKGLINFNLRNKSGHTLLDMACLNGSKEWCQFAFENTPLEQHAQNNKKETPLMLAVRGATEEKDNLETIKFLLSKEPDLKAQNAYGQTIKDYLKKAPIFVKGLIEKTIKEKFPENSFCQKPITCTSWNLNPSVSITVKGKIKEYE